MYNYLKIETTNYCNQFCGHCRFSRKYSQESDFISLSKVKSLVSFHKKHKALKKNFTVMLTGGEPLLHPEIIDIIHTLKELGAGHISLATNGAPLINPTLQSQLLSSPLTELIVSLSPTAQEFYEVKGQNQDHIIDIVNNFKKLKPTLIITANYLIHEKSMNRINLLLSSIKNSSFTEARFLLFNEDLSPKQSLLKNLSTESRSLLTKMVKIYSKQKPKVPVFIISCDIDRNDAIVFINHQSQEIEIQRTLLNKIRDFLTF